MNIREMSDTTVNTVFEAGSCIAALYLLHEYSNVQDLELWVARGAKVGAVFGTIGLLTNFLVADPAIPRECDATVLSGLPGKVAGAAIGAGLGYAIGHYIVPRAWTFLTSWFAVSAVGYGLGDIGREAIWGDSY